MMAEFGVEWTAGGGSFIRLRNGSVIFSSSEKSYWNVTHKRAATQKEIAAAKQLQALDKFDSLVQGLRDLGGKPLSQKRLKLLRDQLWERKIVLDPVAPSDPYATLKLAANDRAKFRIRVVKATGQPQEWATIYIRPGATGYDIQHELFHALHARTIGYKNYIKLTPREAEQYVFDQMMKPKTWNQLTAAERQHAIDYLYYKHPGSDLRGHTPSAKNPFE